MSKLKRMFFGLTASTILLANFGVVLPARAQSETEEATTEEVTVAPEEMAVLEVGGGGECCEPWAEKLGLSDEQMEKMVSLKSEYYVRTAPQKAELMSDMKKMMLLMTAEKIDKSAIMSLHEKIANVKSDLCTARVNHMIEMSEVLTPKQREDIRHRMLMHMVDPHHGHPMMTHHHFHHHE